MGDYKSVWVDSPYGEGFWQRSLSEQAYAHFSARKETLESAGVPPPLPELRQWAIDLLIAECMVLEDHDSGHIENLLDVFQEEMPDFEFKKEWAYAGRKFKTALELECIDAEKPVNRLRQGFSERRFQKILEG